MNIWILTSEYPPQAGGVGTYVANAASMFASAGHHTTILMPGDEQNIVEQTNFRQIEFVPGYKYLKHKLPPDGEINDHPAFPYNIMATWPAMSYQFAEEFKRWIRKFGAPDVVEIQEYVATGYYFLARRWLQESPFCDIPVLVHLHTPLFEIDRVNRSPRYKFPNYWIGQMEKFCIRAADGLLSPSNFLRHQMHARLNPNLKIEVIPYPFFPLKPETRLPTRSDILYVGRLEYRKGVVQTVTECARLWEQGHSFTLELVGNDTEFYLVGTSMKAYLTEKFKRYVDAGQLIISAPLSRKKLFERMQRAWCLLVPSLYENHPNVCLEAMSLEVVVLASRQGGQAEMIGAAGESGFLFDWEQPHDFGEKLTHILSLPVEKNRSIGQAARLRAEQRADPARIARRRLALFDQVIDKGKQPKTCYPTVIPPDKLPSIAANDVHQKKGLLSVVIPFHNLGQYLASTLDSILAAGYPEMEIIIVDDGSTEALSLEALDIVRAQNDSRIRMVSTENSGLALTRNYGAALARGEYLTFVDADDQVDPDFFCKAITVLDNYRNVAFVYSWVRHFGAAKGCWVTFNTEFPYMLGHNMLTAFAVARRDLFLQYGQNRPEVEYSLEDFDGWLGMVAAGCVGVSLPEMLVRYRIRANSMYRQMDHNRFLYLFDVITHGHPTAYREHAVDLINLLMANGASYLWDHPALEWKSPQDQLADIRWQRQSVDMTFRLFMKVIAANLRLLFRQPNQVWQKFRRWVYFRTTANESERIT